MRLADQIRGVIVTCQSQSGYEITFELKVRTYEEIDEVVMELSDTGFGPLIQGGNEG